VSELGRLETIYRRLPPPVQNLVFSAWGLRSRHVRFGGEFPALLESLEQSDFDGLDAIRHRQAVSFRAMLRHAVSTVPHYGDLRGVENVDGDPEAMLDRLAELPLTTKGSVKASPDRFLPERIPEGGRIAMRTSGTTGTPLTIFQTLHAVRFQWAIWWRHKARFGIRPGEPFLSFGARVPVLGEKPRVPWRENYALRQTYLVTSLLRGRVLEQAIDLVRRRRFAYFTGYPSAMYVLAREILDRGVDLEHPPRMIFTGSDALTPGFRGVIERAFRSTISDNFGSAEMCGNLSQCPDGRYHVDHELGIVELLPVAHTDDSSVRRIVCTGLVNRAMPLIRYDLGDFARVSDEPCRCGRSSPSVLSVEGRAEDFIQAPDGRLVTGLNQVLEWVPELIEAQVRQEEPNVLYVLLVTREPVSKPQRMVLLGELRKRVGEAMDIRLRRVDHIPREANGKFRAVLSAVAAPLGESADEGA
jgi:phenylacetate-CoA ligase